MRLYRPPLALRTVKNTIYPIILPKQQLLVCNPGFRERFFDSNQMHLNIRFGMCS